MTTHTPTQQPKRGSKRLVIYVVLIAAIAIFLWTQYETSVSVQP
jgi:hypothetical protein